MAAITEENSHSPSEEGVELADEAGGAGFICGCGKVLLVFCFELLQLRKQVSLGGRIERLRRAPWRRLHCSWAEEGFFRGRLDKLLLLVAAGQPVNAFEQ